MISDQYKFIFSHIPRCAGTSINSFFLNKDKTKLIRMYDKPGEHKTFSQFKEKFPVYYKSYFKFCFVRNPFDRCVSLYFLRKRVANEMTKANIKLPAHWPNIDEINKYSFSDMVKKSKETEDKNIQYLEAGCRDDWWLSDDVVDEVNFIGKIENMKSDFKEVCNRLRINIKELPDENKSEFEHYTKYYDSDYTREIVAEKYAKDIEYFGYEFGA